MSFPPTYKYKFNSEKYVSDATKSERRTPSGIDMRRRGRRRQAARARDELGVFFFKKII